MDSAFAKPQVEVQILGDGGSEELVVHNWSSFWKYEFIEKVIP